MDANGQVKHAVDKYWDQIKEHMDAGKEDLVQLLFEIAIADAFIAGMAESQNRFGRRINFKDLVELRDKLKSEGHDFSFSSPCA